MGPPMIKAVEPIESCAVRPDWVNSQAANDFFGDFGDFKAMWSIGLSKIIQVPYGGLVRCGTQTTLEVVVVTK